eukprot:133941-Chlamydomonas_euryale.AAC.2
MLWLPSGSAFDEYAARTAYAAAPPLRSAGASSGAKCGSSSTARLSRPSSRSKDWRSSCVRTAVCSAASFLLSGSGSVATLVWPLVWANSLCGPSTRPRTCTPASSPSQLKRDARVEQKCGRESVAHVQQPPFHAATCRAVQQKPFPHTSPATTATATPGFP